MKPRIPIALSILAVIVFLVTIQAQWDLVGDPSGESLTKDAAEPALAADRPDPEDEALKSGPDWQRRFFEEWHEPYGAFLDAEIQDTIWEEIERLPSERESRDVNAWEMVGPSGMLVAGGARYTGRVLDINAVDGNGLTIASASGGLWQYILLTWLPMTDQITSQWIGSVAIDPNDRDTIIIGTGEPHVHGGTGLWKSTDGGETWARKTMPTESSAYYRVRYSPDGSIVHAAADSGYFRSIDGGETWQQTFAGDTGDLALTPNPAIAYMTVWDEGLYGTLNGGLNWGKFIHTDLPSSHVTRGAVTVCDADPGVIYVAFAYQPDPPYGPHVLRGIYKSTDHAGRWADISPPDNYMVGQGWYNNVISVSPTDPDLVLAGGVLLYRTTNGGDDWNYVDDVDLHVDYHAMQWHADGARVWVGTDGGWSYSTAQGASETWVSWANKLPITQYVEIDVAGTTYEAAGIIGGSQDNGISATWDGGDYWYWQNSGDGGGLEFTQPFVNDFWFAAGLAGDGLLFHRYFTEDGGTTWVEDSVGIHQSNTPYPKIRIDRWGVFFTHSGGWVYSRSSEDTAWITEVAAPFNHRVRELTVSPASDYPVLYACTSNYPADRMYVKDIDGWYERSGQLPTGVRVRKVVPHPTDSYRAYALMNGLDTPGQKIYVTGDRGLNWWNITGDLPNVPLADLVVHPENNGHLFVGTEYGCYRTVDGGNHWERWNNGMPKAVVVTEFKTLDVRDYGEGYHIYAATYGRSIWRREISGEDPPSDVAHDMPAAPVAILNIHPNPANPAATIEFTTARDGRVAVTIHDVRGRLVASLLDGDLTAGRHAITWQGRDDGGRGLPSGLYFARVRAAGQTAAQKLVLAK